ncbi:hypothetical protein L1987_25198 [Smallanthus sonchifolius]|uniref:Uncharacterized protein n=1 Tax=Smallanthus sonchifolius TaxID=185202 RepID=A0ACB9ILW3_9ASTR|nr:hypothetical protein L1987_25198 [Smallanthus sonchifolius]
MGSFAIAVGDDFPNTRLVCWDISGSCTSSETSSFLLAKFQAIAIPMTEFDVLHAPKGLFFRESKTKKRTLFGGENVNVGKRSKQEDQKLEHM